MRLLPMPQHWDYPWGAMCSKCLLEEMRIKLSIVVSNLLGASGLRILRALAEGETDPRQLAQLGDERLQCTEEQAELTSWVGTCPGKDESAEENHSTRSAKGNKYLRRVLNQAAHAAVKKNGSYFQAVFRRLLPRLGYQSAIWAVAHRLCRVVWKILHEGVRFIEQGRQPDPQAKRKRAQMLAPKVAQALPMSHLRRSQSRRQSFGWGCEPPASRTPPSRFHSRRSRLYERESVARWTCWRRADRRDPEIHASRHSERQ